MEREENTTLRFRWDMYDNARDIALTKIFSVSILDKQISVFNSTKYASHNQNPLCLGQEGFAHPQHSNVSSHSLICPSLFSSPIYIPPHHREIKNPHLNPRHSQILHHPLLVSEDMVLIINDLKSNGKNVKRYRPFCLLEWSHSKYA